MTASPLDLGAGWYIRPRALSAWPCYEGLSVFGRRLVDVLLERARWCPGEVWLLGRRIELQPGELIASEEQLAEFCGAGCSRKSIRTAIRQLAAGGFLDRRPALPAGQCPHIITVRDYDLLRPQAGEEGPRNGQRPGEAGASSGPAEGPAGAPKERREQGEPRNSLKRARGRAGAPVPADPFHGQASGPVPLAGLGGDR